MLSILLSLFLAAPVFASQNAEPDGVRVVGKGGGFAEMQAYAFDKNLPNLARICSQQPESCGLLPKEQEVLRTFVLNEKLVLNSLLTINTSCTAPFIHLKSDQSSSVDSCFLYAAKSNEFGPVPKSPAEIGRIVIQLRFTDILKEKMNPFEIEDLTNKLLRDLNFNNQSTVVQAGNRTHKINLWSMDLAGKRSSFLSFENFESSLDLTPDLEASLACTDKEINWSLRELSVENLSYQEGVVRGQIEWSCDQQRYRATLTLQLSYQNETIGSFQFSTWGKERL
jgi:hypothetical protein